MGEHCSNMWLYIGLAVIVGFCVGFHVGVFFKFYQVFESDVQRQERLNDEQRQNDKTE